MSEVSEHEIVTLTQEALKLGSAACHFDKSQNYLAACDYYDKCLLNMDEVLNKLNPDSNEWKKLYEIRVKYDDRMEYLRDCEEAEKSTFGLNSLSLGKSEVKPPTAGNSKAARKRKKLSETETDFAEIDWNSGNHEGPPTDKADIPYWLLRNIKRTIEQGGFLTKDIFIPKRIWMQHDVKFSGLNAKTAAFEIIIKVITAQLDGLYRSLDEDSLDLVEQALINIHEELVTLQNHLSKPFPYIKEHSSVAEKEESQTGSDTGGSAQSTPKVPLSMLCCYYFIFCLLTRDI
jgi:hypothetical protein